MPFLLKSHLKFRFYKITLKYLCKIFNFEDIYIFLKMKNKLKLLKLTKISFKSKK